MNNVREIAQLNQRELDNVIPPEASWHADYRDTAYIYIGGLPFEASEGDIIQIFSQFGEPVHLNLVRDRETGKSKGFAFLKYEDQRSTDLAVDNLGGATIAGRILRVDHTRYKLKEGEEVLDNTEPSATQQDVDSESGSEEIERRPKTKEEMELEKLIQDHDDDDPMKDFLIQQKREEIQAALQKTEKKARKHRHKHRHRRASPEDSRNRHHRRRIERDEGSRGARRERHRGGRDISPSADKSDTSSRERDPDSSREKRHHRHRRRSASRETGRHSERR